MPSVKKTTPPADRPTYERISAWTRRVGLGRSTTFAMLRDGRLATIKVGGARLIDVEKSLAMLEAESAPPQK